ncbi:DNA-directed RNA polymerase subunit alpha C-terminal domain-containing protein [Metamycoplasma hominis]|uniref:DNA-directed RNA polymerase subunit alpha C-terminal domain-containing protein n=1 Tax=Metamycoplasma hominis TaxID=2098 RepID=UPI001F45F2E6|nr:DNA-directed RNA polymerase subunit alpha C-terminal domain-containing protein [Metamycoplasma hominis]
MIKKKTWKTPKVSVSIDKLNLTIRSLNALRRAGFNNVDEIMKLSDEELSNIKNLGKNQYKILLTVVEWLDSQLNNEDSNKEYAANEEGE